MNDNLLPTKNARKKYFPLFSPLFVVSIVWANSGNQCAFPGCNVELAKKEKSGEKVIVGENAHIKGKKAGSPRYDVNMSDKERDSYENLILLCPTHHKTIDDASGTYTVEKLTEMKVKHEEKVKQIMGRNCLLQQKFTAVLSQIVAEI